jgi:DegV family protein with EDD domain
MLYNGYITLRSNECYIKAERGLKMKYKLIIDNTSDLPQEVIERYDMTVVPLTVIFGDEEFSDLTPVEFYDKLEASPTLPLTSQVTPARFKDAFQKELDNGNKIICITIGSNGSGTYQSACIAKQELETEDITVIDSNGLCLGTGVVVLKVARMLEENKSIEEILEVVKYYTNNKIEHLFCVDTLKYLRKGGRIRASKAIIAEALNLKPILNVEDGLTKPLDKVRGKKKIISYFTNHVKKTIDMERADFILIGHSLDPEMADKMVTALREEIGFTKDIIIGEIGPIIGTHTGKGVLSVYYIKK